MIVKIKCYYNIKDIKEQAIIITEGEWGARVEEVSRWLVNEPKHFLKINYVRTS
jgi:hypothetical protein